MLITLDGQEFVLLVQYMNRALLMFNNETDDYLVVYSFYYSYDSFFCSKKARYADIRIALSKLYSDSIII